MAKTRKGRIAGIESEMERLEIQRKHLLTQEKEAEWKASVTPTRKHDIDL